MDISIWHSALPNTAAHARRQLIIGYQSDGRRGGTGAIPSAADVERYEAEVQCMLRFACLLLPCFLTVCCEFRAGR